MASTLGELFEQSNWANEKLIDVCSSLSEEQLDAEAPGTYGSVKDTLLHIVSAQERYVSIFRPETASESISEREFPGFEVLKEHARRSGAAITEIAESLDPAGTITRAYQGTDYEMDATVVIVQALNHSTEHRTQIKTVLTHQGVTPPELDGWTYGADAGQIRKA